MIQVETTVFEYNAEKMFRTFVYFIVVISLIAVHFTMAFSSNIHEEMTTSEKLAVFGSADSVPEYQVVHISLPEARRRRKINVAINMTVKLGRKEINLNLRPTAGYLATKYTPVWLAKSDENAYKKIHYAPYVRAMRDIGEFQMYHDVENSAAVTTYTDPTEGLVIEGIVTPHYAIRSLPKRLLGKTLTALLHIIRHENAKKRSITFDDKEDTGHFAVFKVPAASNYVKPSSIVDLGNLQREKRAGHRKLPKAVYPEILVVLDHNAIRNHTIAQALRYILAFWNGADLIYRQFDHPKIHLNIAGIIIAADELAAPYMASTISITDGKGGETVYYHTLPTWPGVILSGMGKYFYQEQVRFPMNGYDMIIAMSTEGLCADSGGITCWPAYAHANRNTACLSTREVSRMKNVTSNGFIGYTWDFRGIVSAVRATALIFGAELDFTTRDVPNTYGIMSSSFYHRNDTFLWSKRSRRFFSQYFSSTKSKCLDNKPRWRNAVRQILPGRWMSMDGQCRNDGFAKACTLKKKSMCAVKGCQAEGSVKCIRTSAAPLPGSKCGNNKHCSTKKQCVPN